MNCPPRMNINDSRSIKYKFKIGKVWYRKEMKINKYTPRIIDFKSDNGPGPMYDELEYECFKDLYSEWMNWHGRRKHLKQNRLC
jgi:hypothetical protein